MLTEEELQAIEKACTGPDAKETYTGVVTEQVVLELVREIRRLRREGRQPATMNSVIFSIHDRLGRSLGFSRHVLRLVQHP